MRLPRRQTPVPSQPWAAARSSAVRVIAAVLGGWGASQLTLWAFGLSHVAEAFSVNASSLEQGEYWRLFSSQLFHANFGHFAITLLVLFLAGRDVEPILGRKPFVALCLASGVLGNLASCAATPTTLVCGFSAAAAAVLVAYTTILPELEYRVGLFPWTVPFRAKYFSLIVVLASGLCAATQTANSVGPSGILLGSVLGWAWARQLGFSHPFWFQRRRMERRQQELRRERMNAADFIAEEIDPILEKIARKGISSLSRAERRILEEGRGKLVRAGVGKE